MSKFLLKEDAPLLEIVRQWLPHMKVKMTSLLLVEDEKIVEIVLNQLGKVISSDDKHKTAAKSAYDILTAVSCTFKVLNNDQDRKFCAAIVCELLGVCMTLYDDWEVQDAVGDLYRTADEEGFYQFMGKTQLTLSFNDKTESCPFADLKYLLNPQSDKPNFFAPKKNLQELLKKTWFEEFRNDLRYDVRWTDAFVEALMASEYGEGIAQQWAVKGARGKRDQIRGYVVGVLKDAGVLKGSNDSIARKIGITENPRTFSSYMGDGKKQPYAEWVKEYVAG